MVIKNGIAYSGDYIECGTLEEKIKHAIENNINYIQIRTKDIQDVIIIDNQLNKEKLQELRNLIGNYKGTLSVHLPNPVWDYDNLELSESNQLVHVLIKEILLPMGIKDYTIHPHFNRQVYDNLSDNQKQIMLDKMANYFSSLSNLGINLAIENIPVRDFNVIKQMPESEKKKKALKNISYGMTIEEIQNILNLTKRKVNNGRVGITYDTGHSLAMINDINARYQEIDRWIRHFKNDIIIYHIAPNIGSDPLKLTDEAKDYNRQIVEWVYDASQRYGVDALTFIEAHAKFEILTELNNIAELVKDKKKIQLTPELSEIFSNIERDSKLSSSELAKFYLGTPEYQQMFKHMEIQSNQIREQIKQLRIQNPQMSDSDFFSFVMNNHSKNIIESIKKDYGDKLTPEIIERLDNFNISIINTPETRGDMTAHPEKSQVEINEAHFATDVKGIESKIVRAMGTMPHEIFHFVYRILKDENHCDERMVYNLTNGDQATCLGMTGHMLNEGFVEKLSTDFCKRNNIYSTISPTYIQFTKLCDYIMKTNPEVNESFLIKNNYEGILNKFSTEAKEKYKETERTEYLRNFKLKTTSGENRKIDDHEVLSSYNESVKPKYMEQQVQQAKVENKEPKKENEHMQISTPKKQESFAQRSQSEIQVHQQIKQKNQMIKQQKAQKQQLNKPKVKTLSAPSSQGNGSSSNKGYTNVILLLLIVSFVCGALFMAVSMIIGR